MRCTTIVDENKSFLEKNKNKNKNISRRMEQNFSAAYIALEYKLLFQIHK